MESPQIIQLNLDHLDQVYDYVCTEWFDDEPVFSSIGLHRGSGFLHKQTMEGLKKDYFTKLLKPETGLSFGVFDDQGNVLGIKLGKIMTKETIDKAPNMRWILSLPQALVPSPMWKYAMLLDFMEKYQYKEELTFEQCPGNNGKIYEGAMLGVARRGRGKGLGDKLVKHALHFAREAGCSHAHACTSGKFSQAIFKKNGFEVYFEKNYSDWKDKNGKVIIQHEIHTSAQINVLKL